MRLLSLLLVASPSLVLAEPTLVSGAPLGNPRVDVHVIEQKPVRDAGRFEFTLYPVVPQLNALYTEHVGTMGQVAWHLREHFGFSLSGGGNWINRESPFNGELVSKARIEAQAASSLLWTWTTLAGVEVTPFYGKFAFFESGLAQFSVVLTAGAGLGGTRHQLKPAGTTPATWGDTGVRFMGTFGAGFRLTLGEHVAVRLEVRDVVYTARVDRVNGCSAADLSGVEARSGAGVSAGCALGAFDTPTDLSIARALVTLPSSAVLNSLGAWAGVSFVY